MPQQIDAQGQSDTASSDPILKQVLILVLLIAVPLSVGFLGSMATSEHTEGWYQDADKAPWNPPSWVFGPVWSTLYAMMGFAAWLVWRKRREVNARGALWLFFIQLVFNASWTPLFFGGYPALGTPALWIAMAVITILIVLLIPTIRAFYRISTLAAGLLVPYLLWTVYASTLNLWIAVAN